METENYREHLVFLNHEMFFLKFVSEVSQESLQEKYREMVALEKP